MSTQFIVVIFIGFWSCLSLLQGLRYARKAMKKNDKVLTAFAVVFIICSVVLLLCLNSIIK